MEVLDKEASLLEPLDGLTDRYCARKLNGCSHDEAFVEIIDEFLECAEVMQKNADTEWTRIPKLSAL